MAAINCIAIVAVLLSAIANAQGAGGVRRAANQTQWRDCGGDVARAADLDLHFVDVVSAPPVSRPHQNVTVTKRGYATRAHANLTVLYTQYRRTAAGAWAEFFNATAAGCDPHARMRWRGAWCPTARGGNFTLETVHDDGGTLPFGLYRSRQTFFDARAPARAIGCVELLVRYVKSDSPD